MKGLVSCWWQQRSQDSTLMAAPCRQHLPHPAKASCTFLIRRVSSSLSRSLSLPKTSGATQFSIQASALCDSVHHQACTDSMMVDQHWLQWQWNWRPLVLGYHSHLSTSPLQSLLGMCTHIITIIIKSTEVTNPKLSCKRIYCKSLRNIFLAPPGVKTISHRLYHGIRIGK